MHLDAFSRKSAWRSRQTGVVPFRSPPQPQKVESSAVVPRGTTAPRQEQIVAGDRRTRVITTFGMLEALLGVIGGISIAWAAWPVALNVAPNETTNYLMNTGEFDHGSFWLLSDPDPASLTIACSGLILVLVAYLWVLLGIVPCNQTKGCCGGDNFCDYSSLCTKIADVLRRVVRALGGQEDRVLAIWSDLTEYDGVNRKLWVAGFPVVLCYTYAALITANCLSCVSMESKPSRLSALDEVLIDMIDIEGPTAGLSTLPNDLFAKMTSLTFLHLGLHPSLARMPLFDGLSNLKTLLLTLLLSLEEVLPVELLMLFLSNVASLPDFAPLANLTYFVMLDAPACCNGVSCPANVILPNAQHKKIIEKFGQTVCINFPSDRIDFVSGPTKASIDECIDVLYHKCVLSVASESTPAEHTTMCFNDRMNVIGCTDTPINVAIRKLQISRNVGTSCYPVKEEWLGCRPK
uniref:WLGC domain-containing protein n=1 Tax=Globisporangium ultimum (strain ATCC 200006 / CBS 805.95 / DAOM BR144) TaxID=431595 RepID=K3XAC1_GLOUD